MLSYGIKCSMEELNVQAAQLCELIEVLSGTLSHYLRGLAFPKEDQFMKLREELPLLTKLGSYENLKLDYKEFVQSNRSKPTRRLLEFMKVSGYTYFKNEGRFKKSTQEEKVEKISSRRFKTEIQKTPKGEEVISLLTKEFPLPKEVEYDLSMISDEEKYQRAYEQLYARDEMLLEMRRKNHQAMLILKGLRTCYEEFQLCGNNSSLSTEVEKAEDRLSKKKQALLGFNVSIQGET